MAALVIWALALGAGARAASASAQARRTWLESCASCHGSDGTGQTSKGRALYVANMATAAWQQGISDLGIKEAIQNGVKRTKTVPAPPATLHGAKITASAQAATELQVKQQMDAYRDKLQPEEIDGLLQYIRQFAP